MTTTPQFIASDFIKTLEDNIAKQELELLQTFVSAAWQSMQPYLPYIIVAFVVILLWALIMAVNGRWGLLGKVVYRTFLGVTLGITIAIKGWGVLLSPYFDLIYFVAYLFSYNLTGKVLAPFRRKNRY